MVDEYTSERPPFVEWEEFAHRQAGHPFLQHDPLYALSEPIIDAIKPAVPTFFTEDQERFERDLAQTASFGFFHRNPMGLTARDRQADPRTGLSLREQHERSTRAINEMIAEELGRDGLTDGEIDEYLRRHAEKREVIETRQDAYVGWLISNQGFRDEVRELRASWELVVQERGRFPRYPRWPNLDGPGGTDAFHENCYRFYCRWGLDRMLTWDWPVPMEPDLVGRPLRAAEHRLAVAGVILFVPWYLLRGEKLDLQGIAQLARTNCGATHLRDWLHNQSSRRGDELGDIRYERLQWIYRYHELVLVRRYGTACRGHVQRLDRALASVIDRDADTVKQLRQELKRVLHGS